MKKILLDENLPEELGQLLKSRFDIFTVHEMEWATLQNGELLRAMFESGFNVLLTVDKNLPYQQNLAKYSLQVVVIRTLDNRFRRLAPHFEAICAELASLSAMKRFTQLI